MAKQFDPQVAENAATADPGKQHSDQSSNISLEPTSAGITSQGALTPPANPESKTEVISESESTSQSASPSHSGSTSTPGGSSRSGGTSHSEGIPASGETSQSRETLEWNPSLPGETTDNIPEPDELLSDGSASAFEGTESIDSQEQDRELKRKAETLKNDPSGRSNY